MGPPKGGEDCQGKQPPSNGPSTRGVIKGLQQITCTLVLWWGQFSGPQELGWSFVTRR